MPEHYDLVITGTSFASSFFLKKALEHLGPSTKILVLERGKHFPHAERLDKKRSNKPLGNPSAVSTYETTSDKMWVFDPSFGGSSNCWTGCTPRFLPSDFKLNSNYGIAVDWPVTYGDLLPYYEEAEDLMQIGGPDRTPWPMQKPYNLPPQTLSTVDVLLQKEYGNQYISQPTARATQTVGMRPECCTSAICRLCPINSKFTIDNSMLPLFDDPRITLKLESQVIALDLTGNQADAVIYRSGGNDHSVTCDTVVLGANAIFNPHILLNSGDESPLTGAGICEQVGKFVKVYYDGLQNVGGSSIITANGYMMYDGAHRNERAACLIESFNTPFIRNEPGKWREMSIFKFIYEDLPNNSNRVVKSNELTKPKVIYQGHSEYCQRGLDHLEDDFNRFFNFLPISHYEINPETEPTEFHICSTTRMGNDPQSSVVDPRLIHHKFRNVVVLGSSVFPTISPANPTLTLGALSLYSADAYFS